MAGLSPSDPSSYSRPDLAVITSIFLSLNVDFKRNVLYGHVDLTVDKVQESVNEIILDSKGLNIAKILDDDNTTELKYTLSPENGEFGSKLVVQLPQENKKSFNITIFYETSPSASGLQWLTPEQTAGKQHPYLFSQFQAIHARSVVPCQDTPAVKTKYSASITAPKELTVLMSAIRKDTNTVDDLKISHFVQDVPVPSYLIAIAVGALESRKLGPRSHVWAEKELIEASAYEFAETEHQLKTAEEICGPYVWGIYDLLVLPPSFAYGGMENPCLTFVTPTLLAGDRSLANVVAHEIAHSWTGNLITNRNFEHFWLNEGFTVFVERKIKGRLTSAKEQDFDAYGRLSELNETVNLLGKDNPLTRLVVDLKGVHPDDAFSVVPYEKGQTFLRYLETTVGGPNQEDRECLVTRDTLLITYIVISTRLCDGSRLWNMVYPFNLHGAAEGQQQNSTVSVISNFVVQTVGEFEPFLKKYFDNFKYKSIDTNDFKSFFEAYFEKNAAIKSVDWDAWLYTPGMPLKIPDYDTSLAQICINLSKKLIDWNEKNEFPITNPDIQNLTTEQRIYFLQALLNAPPLSIHKLKTLDSVSNFSKIQNSEIKFRWFRIGLKAHWNEIVAPVLAWINEVGRMKFARPLYRDLFAWEETRQKSVENFQANKQYMMHVVSYTVSKDLKLAN